MQHSRVCLHLSTPHADSLCVFSISAVWLSCHGKSILQVPDTGTRVLDNTRPFLCSSIVSFWITLACSKERKDHIFGQYLYTKNVPVLTNTGTFQYLGPEVYFFHCSDFSIHCYFVSLILEWSLWQQEAWPSPASSWMNINLTWTVFE